MVVLAGVQEISSEPSLQSFCPSQCQLIGKHSLSIWPEEKKKHFRIVQLFYNNNTLNMLIDMVKYNSAEIMLFTQPIKYIKEQGKKLQNKKV